MKFTDKLKDRFFNTEDFYYRIIGNDFPLKYKKTGYYLKNVFTFYKYSKELVLDSIEFFDYLSEHDFDFRNMDYFVMSDFNSFIFNDYHALFEIYDNIFIKKNYQFLYNEFDEFKARLNGENFKLNDTYSELPLLLLIYAQNRVDIRGCYFDNDIERFIQCILKIITILFWINKETEFTKINTITDRILLRDDFIDRCMMKGVDISSYSFHQIDYIGNLIYNNEFMIVNKKLIK